MFITRDIWKWYQEARCKPNKAKMTRYKENQVLASEEVGGGGAWVVAGLSSSQEVKVEGETMRRNPVREPLYNSSLYRLQMSHVLFEGPNLN